MGKRGPTGLPLDKAGVVQLPLVDLIGKDVALLPKCLQHQLGV